MNDEIKLELHLCRPDDSENLDYLWRMDHQVRMRLIEIGINKRPNQYLRIRCENIELPHWQQILLKGTLGNYNEGFGSTILINGNNRVAVGNRPLHQIGAPSV